MQGDLTALVKDVVENLNSLLQEGPVGNSAPRVFLRSARPLRTSSTAMETKERSNVVGKSRVYRNKVVY
jgi:hypothetical protein